MTEIITARYEGGVLLPLEDTGLQERQMVRLHIVPPRVCVTAAMARRKVNRFVLDEISYLMGGEQPTLVETDRLVWRVPVVLTYPGSRHCWSGRLYRRGRRERRIAAHTRNRRGDQPQCPRLGCPSLIRSNVIDLTAWPPVRRWITRTQLLPPDVAHMQRARTVT
jgi:predicted DNA-binding antitoxin AbrB/MazE fold protein